jgi:Holliday junction resolvase RusA-like endonuclease
VDDHAQLWREHVDKRVREALKAVGASWLPQKGEAMEARMIFRMPSKDERELVRRELDLDALEIQADGNSQGGGLGVGLVIELRVVAVGSYHVKVPDADNLAKLAMDVLKKGGALGELDDCALARIEVLKLRA